MSLPPNTPIQFTNKFYRFDQYAYYGLGMPQVTFGFVNIVQVNGVGLLTDGFVWQIPELWFAPESVDGIATGWTAAAGYSGCAAASLISTAWTSSQSFGSEFNF